MGAPIVHIEFKSADLERTATFYDKLFGWKTAKNASGSYMKVDSADAPSAGWIRADLVQSPGPIAYLTVEDLPGKLEEVEAAGGRVLVRSLPFAGGGEIGLFADPDGNVLGLWRPKAGAAPAAAPGSDDAEAGDPKPSAAKTTVKAAPKTTVKPKKKR